jgi:hypothetical protein
VAILGAAVGVVGVLCLLDLLLTFGVIRRLREHTEILSRSGPAAPPVIGPAPGERVAVFSAVTTGGERLSGPGGLRVAAFFSSSCSACPERVGPFTDYLRAHQIARENVVSVVTGLGASPPPYVDRLAAVSLVCMEAEDGELARAFKVRGFPAFCVLDGAGAMLASGYEPAMLPEPLAAPRGAVASTQPQ